MIRVRLVCHPMETYVILMDEVLQVLDFNSVFPCLFKWSQCSVKLHPINVSPQITEKMEISAYI